MGLLGTEICASVGLCGPRDRLCDYATVLLAFWVVVIVGIAQLGAFFSCSSFCVAGFFGEFVNWVPSSQ